MIRLRPPHPPGVLQRLIALVVGGFHAPSIPGVGRAGRGEHALPASRRRPAPGPFPLTPTLSLQGRGGKKGHPDRLPPGERGQKRGTSTVSHQGRRGAEVLPLTVREEGAQKDDPRRRMERGRKKAATTREGRGGQRRQRAAFRAHRTGTGSRFRARNPVSAIAPGTGFARERQVICRLKWEPGFAFPYPPPHNSLVTRSPPPAVDPLPPAWGRDRERGALRRCGAARHQDLSPSPQPSPSRGEGAQKGHPDRLPPGEKGRENTAPDSEGRGSAKGRPQTANGEGRNKDRPNPRGGRSWRL